MWENILGPIIGFTFGIGMLIWFLWSILHTLNHVDKGFAQPTRNSTEKELQHIFSTCMSRLNNAEQFDQLLRIVRHPLTTIATLKIIAEMVRRGDTKLLTGAKKYVYTFTQNDIRDIQNALLSNKTYLDYRVTQLGLDPTLPSDWLQELVKD